MRLKQEQIDNLPRPLVKRSQWVAASITPHPDRSGKTEKRPVNPHTGSLASSTDPATWGTLEQALAMAERLGAQGAVGYVFSADDPYTGIDFDDCYDGDGILAPEVGERVRALDSYTERSLSGRGLHVIVEGKLPPGGRRPSTTTCSPRPLKLRSV